MRTSSKPGGEDTTTTVAQRSRYHPPAMHSPPLHIVLLHPEIPNNTGTIGRTAAATGCRLHIIHPISFDMSEKAVRRAGLDYWPLVDCRHHESWEAYLLSAAPKRMWLYTTTSSRPHWEATFAPGDHLLFGNETSGAPAAVHEYIRTHYGADHSVTLPMIDDPRARSLNLSNAVCAGVYEGLRQIAGR